MPFDTSPVTECDMLRLTLLSLMLTVCAGGCVHSMAYSPEQGLGPHPGPLVGTRASIKLIGDSAVGVVTGNGDGVSEAGPFVNRALYLGLGSFFIADLPGTLTMDVIAAPNEIVHALRATGNGD